MDTATKDQIQTRDLTEIIPNFKLALSNHGLDTSKLDDGEWQRVVSEIQPLFSGYGAPYTEGGGTFDR